MILSGARVAWFCCRKSLKGCEFKVGFPIRRLENSVNPALNSNQIRIRQRKEKDGLCLSFAVPKIQWDSNPTAPMAISLWETFTFFMIQIFVWIRDSTGFRDNLPNFRNKMTD